MKKRARKGYTIVECKKCKVEFYAPNARKYCDDCQRKEWYTCQDCGGKKKYKYSTWCYQCSLKHRDISKSKETIKIAIEAARSEEACAARSKALMGHSVSKETREKIGAAIKKSGHSRGIGRRLGKSWKGRKKPQSFIEAMRRRMTGENNPMWKDGSSAQIYGPGWTERLKEQIRERDNRTCQICGIPSKETYRKLDVHHIDGDKKNNSPDNLVTLCHSCHQKITIGTIEDPFKTMGAGL